MLQAQTYSYVVNDQTISFKDIYFDPQYNSKKIVLAPAVDHEVNVTLPFKISLFCRQSDTISVSEDGIIGLGRDRVLPNDNAGYGLVSYEYIMAPWWKNWRRAASSNIVFNIIGNAPNRTAIVQWTSMQVSASLSTANATFQVQIFETTGKIAFVYQSTALSWSETPDFAYAKNSSIGLKGACKGITTPEDKFVLDHAAPILPDVGSNLYEMFNNSDKGSLLFTPIKTTPIGLATPNATLCTATKCNILYTTTLSAVGMCSTEGVTYPWSIIKDFTISNATKLEGITPTVNATLDTGSYTLTWNVKDACGNVSPAYTSKIDVKDCIAPTVLVKDRTVVLIATPTLPATASVVLGNIFNSVEDNCTDINYLVSKLTVEKESERPNATTYPTALKSIITFNCDDLKATPDSTSRLRIWTIDRFGNAAYSIAKIKLNDITGACSPPIISTLKGTIKTELNRPVENVVLATVGNSPSVSNTLTNKTGDFLMANLLIDKNYTIRASKTNAEDKYLGLTSFDVSIISEYLLDKKKINSPYALIASDVNLSGDIDVADISILRSFLLRKSDALPAGIWRFVDKTYVFKDITNPFNEDFPEFLTLKVKPEGNIGDFIAVKVGDVNLSAEPTPSPSPGAISNSVGIDMKTADIKIKAGEEYLIDFKINATDAYALQGTLSFDNAQIKSISFSDFENAQFGVFDKNITMIWHKTNATPSVESTFTVKIKAEHTGYLSDILKLDDVLTPTTAYDEKGNTVRFNLNFNNTKTDNKSLILYQNQPNPATTETSFSFNMPKTSNVTFSVFNTEGKILKSINGNFEAGMNTLRMDISDFAKGVYFYRLNTPEFSAVKKMVVIK
jgi:Secretion system C-terminal sorting domain